jgi:hypothetical protein
MVHYHSRLRIWHLPTNIPKRCKVVACSAVGIEQPKTQNFLDCNSWDCLHLTLGGNQQRLDGGRKPTAVATVENLWAAGKHR